MLTQALRKWLIGWDDPPPRASPIKTSRGLDGWSPPNINPIEKSSNRWLEDDDHESSVTLRGRRTAPLDIEYKDNDSLSSLILKKGQSSRSGILGSTMGPVIPMSTSQTIDLLHISGKHWMKSCAWHFPGIIYRYKPIVFWANQFHCQLSYLVAQ